MNCCAPQRPHQWVLLASEGSPLEILGLRRDERGDGAQILIPEAKDGARGIVGHQDATARVRRKNMEPVEGLDVGGSNLSEDVQYWADLFQVADAAPAKKIVGETVGVVVIPARAAHGGQQARQRGPGAPGD
jgi:hypothetical protein